MFQTSSCSKIREVRPLCCFQLPGALSGLSFAGCLPTTHINWHNSQQSLKQKEMVVEWESKARLYFLLPHVIVQWGLLLPDNPTELFICLFVCLTRFFDNLIVQVIYQANGEHNLSHLVEYSTEMSPWAKAGLNWANWRTVPVTPAWLHNLEAPYYRAAQS